MSSIATEFSGKRFMLIKYSIKTSYQTLVTSKKNEFEISFMIFEIYEFIYTVS